MIDPQRKQWNQQQQALQKALSPGGDPTRAVEIFLSQHAMLHSAHISQSGLFSFEDEIWQGLSEEAARCIPPKMDHSIVWIFWHLARIEDATMNLLVAGSPQLLLSQGWLERMKATARDTGNAMSPAEIAELSASIDIAALREYRSAVGGRTRQIVSQLQPHLLKQKVDPVWLQRVMDEGAVVEAARGLIDYWGNRTISGLLLMPPTRHNFIHLNEAERIKKKLLR
jgi:hypothetical protein